MNWKEMARLADLIRPELSGLFVDRVIVPERPLFPQGYLKNEWSIRLNGRREEGSFLLSVRAQHPYFAFIPGKGPKAAPLGTRSAFDLELSKRLRGLKLLSLETLPRERTLILWFSGPTARESVGLAVNLIPAAPEAILIEGTPPAAGKSLGFQILTRSRPNRDLNGIFIPPDGAKAPIDPPVRASLEEILSGDLRQYCRALESSLEREAFSLRLSSAQRELRERVKHSQLRIRQTETALKEAERDQDWQRFGDLLKAALFENPELQASGKKWVRRVRSFKADFDIEWVDLPADPKLGASEQVEKYYQLARRRARRILEAQMRLETLNGNLTSFKRLLALAPEPGDFRTIERLERAVNGGALEPLAARDKKNPKKSAWLGKSFVSKDGLAIWVGKGRDENLELTFKHARGNDIWMHVRGRPGAHVLIPLQPGKSAPLETLLDGAVLAVYYSGGEHWGKTEVDYAYKKHVRRIKDSTEVSYVNNKTLIVEPDPARIKRLTSRTD